MAYSPDGKYIVFTNEESEGYLYNVSETSLIKKLGDHFGDLANIAISNEYIVSNGSLGYRYFWYMPDGRFYKKKDPRVPTSNSYSPIAFTPDGQWLVNSSGVSGIKKVEGFGCDPGSNVKDPDFVISSDGLTIVSGGNFGLMYVCTFEEGFTNDEIINNNSLKNGHGFKFSTSGDTITSVAISPNNQLIAGGDENKYIYLWDVKNGELLQTLGNHTDSITDVVFSPDGLFLISASLDGRLLIWGVGP